MMPEGYCFHPVLQQCCGSFVYLLVCSELCVEFIRIDWSAFVRASLSNFSAVCTINIPLIFHLSFFLKCLP